MRYNHLIGKGFHRWTEGTYTPGQIEAFSDYESSFILLSGSYRSGKTELLARAIIRHLITFPDAKAGVFRAKLASIKKSTLITILELIHPSWLKPGQDGWSNTDLQANFINGSTLSFIGADFPDRLGSIELTIAGIDEASEVSEEAITMIQGRLSGGLEIPPNYDSLEPGLKRYVDATLNLRQTFLACNPKGKNHPLYEKFFKSKKALHTAYVSNSIANNNLPVNYLVQNLAAYVRSDTDIDWLKEQIRLIRAGERDPNGLHLKEYLTPLGQRNLLGLWVALEGAIYNLDEDLHLLEKIPEKWKPTSEYICGVDYGYHNPRITVLQKCLNGKGLVSYAAVDYWKGEEGGSTGDDLIDALKSLQDKYAWSKVYFPHDQPGIYKKARGVFGASKLKKAKTDVLPGISTVSSFVNTGRLIFLRTKGYEKCWEEFTGYEWDKDKDGELLDRPIKTDDHFPDSVRYPIYTLHKRDTIVEEEPEEEPLTGLDLMLSRG